MSDSVVDVPVPDIDPEEEPEIEPLNDDEGQDPYEGRDNVVQDDLSEDVE